MIFDVTVIVRSIGERTEQPCINMILEQGIPKSNIFVVHEVPFSKALKKSFNIGIEQERKWTFCLDADVLLRKNAIEKLIHLANNYNKNICEIQGLVLDKFFAGPRQAGNRLYRSSLLNKAIKLIPAEGVSIRPETYTLKQMDKLGYPHVVVPFILGTHDDEQYNRDIYRKFFIQGVKHLDMSERFVNHWKKNIHKDHDYKVALKAFSEGIYNTEKLYINSEQEIYKKKFIESGFKEKKELDPNHITIQSIEDTIANWQIINGAINQSEKNNKVNFIVLIKKIPSTIKIYGIKYSFNLIMNRVFSQFALLFKRKIESQKKFLI